MALGGRRSVGAGGGGPSLCLTGSTRSLAQTRSSDPLTLSLSLRERGPCDARRSVGVPSPAGRGTRVRGLTDAAPLLLRQSHRLREASRVLTMAHRDGTGKQG